jgi:hypothetical protein
VGTPLRPAGTVRASTAAQTAAVATLWAAAAGRRALSRSLRSPLGQRLRSLRSLRPGPRRPGARGARALALVYSGGALRAVTKTPARPPAVRAEDASTDGAASFQLVPAFTAPRRPFRRCALLEHPRANNSALRAAERAEDVKERAEDVRP